MSSVVYGLHWTRISLDEKARQASEPTKSIPETSTANLNSIETKNTLDSGVYSTDKPSNK